MVDCRDVVQSSARRVVAVLSTFSSLKEKKLDPRNKAFVKVMSRNSFERIFRSGPMLLLSCMLFSSPSPLTLVSIFFAFSSAHGKDKASAQNCISTMLFNHVSTSLYRRRSVEPWRDIFVASGSRCSTYVSNFTDVPIRLICY